MEYVYSFLFLLLIKFAFPVDSSTRSTLSGTQSTSTTEMTSPVNVTNTQTSTVLTSTSTTSTKTSTSTTSTKTETTTPTIATIQPSTPFTTQPSSTTSALDLGTDSTLTSTILTRTSHSTLTIEHVTTSVGEKTTSSSNGNGSHDGSRRDDDCPDAETAFGKYGLAAFAVACAVCAVLIIVVMVMIFKYCGRRKHKSQIPDTEKNTPKLQMLEIRNASVKSQTKTVGGAEIGDDGLNTYSLDYEKHVQNKIQEHKRATKPPPGASETPVAGVSTFMIGKRPSVMSDKSFSSQASPKNLPEHTPLMSVDDDAPVVFNFAKKPGESLESSNVDSSDRRKSNVSSGKGGRKGSQIPQDRFDTDTDV